MLAGLYSAIIVALIAVLLRANSSVVFAPRSMQAYLVSMVVLHLVQSESYALLQDPQQTLTAVFFVILLSGIMQAAFGAIGAGSLVKYIPYPVIAGFQNAGAILLILSQIAPMLGLSHRLEPGTLLEQLRHTQPLTLTIGVVTCFLMLYAGKLSKRIPAVITGMFAGIGLYYLFRYVGYSTARASARSSANSISPCPTCITCPVSMRWCTSANGGACCPPCSPGLRAWR